MEHSTSSCIRTQLQQLGCQDEKKVALACRVYMDLFAKPNVTELNSFYDQNFNVIYIVACKGSEIELFLPVLHTDNVDMKLINALQKNNTEKSVYMAICDTSSNILYYNIASGIKSRKLDDSRGPSEHDFPSTSKR